MVSTATAKCTFMRATDMIIQVIFIAMNMDMMLDTITTTSTSTIMTTNMAVPTNVTMDMITQLIFTTKITIMAIPINAIWTQPSTPETQQQHQQPPLAKTAGFPSS